MSLIATSLGAPTRTRSDRWSGVERRARVRLEVTARIVPPETWDQVAAHFDGVVQEQLFVYAGTRWPSARAEAVLFSLGDEVVGGTLMMLQRLPLGLGTIAVAKWGPIFKDAGRPDAAEIYAAMIDRLVADYAVGRRMMLSVLPRANARNWQYDHLMARGFKRGASLLFPNRYIVDLSLPEAEHRARLDQKWRYHLNRSEREDLSFERAGPDRLGEFDALYNAMADRKNFPDHSAYNTIAALFAADSAELRPELFFVRHHGDDSGPGEVVAGAIIFKAGDTGVYLFGATNDKALPLRAGYFMHWRIIDWLRENTRARWYDLGGTDGFQGLHQFKKGMVGEAGVITPVPPVANFAAHRFPYLIGTLAFAGRDLVHRLQRRLDLVIGGKARPDQHRPVPAKAEEA